MMVGGAPKNGGVTIPDGMGGTFGYAVDRFAGPFTESPALVAALRQFNVKGVGLIGEDRGVSADEPIAAAVQAPDPPPRIISFDPDHGEPGQTFYLTVIAVGMKPWYHFSFGDGVKVTDETWLGRNPDGEGERWLCTVTLAPGASLQP